MCDPVSALMGISTAISVGGQLIQHAEQEEAAKKNEASARQSAANSIGLLTLRQQQERRAGAQTIYQMGLEAERAQAMNRVQAGESGVSGISVDLLTDDIERQRLMAEAGTRSNLKDTEDQLQQEKKVVKTNAQAQINSVPKPNPWATGLRIGGTVAEGAGSYMRIRGG